MNDSAALRRPESVLVLVHSQCRQVLLMQRTDDLAFWQSITGALEPGEMPVEAARRELIEETGFDIDKLAVQLIDHKRHNLFEIKGVWRKRYAAVHTHNKEHVFSVQLAQKNLPQLDAKEHAAFVWLPKDEAIVRATSPTNRQAIEDIV